MIGPRIHRDVLALEAGAACAGLALGCAYSGSDEYEAEVIRLRRAAGVYGPAHAVPPWLWLAVLAAAAVWLVAL